MTEQPQDKSIRDNVLQAIEAGKVSMRPKWHFVLRALVLLVGVILATLAVIYLLSFIIFMLRQSGVWFAPGFGFRGIGEFLFALPWLMLLIAALFIVLLEILVRRYAFAYGKPLLYSALGVVAFVLLAGVVVAQTPLHRGLFNQAANDQLPFAGPLYKGYFVMRRPDNVAVGRIVEIKDAEYDIISPREEALEIFVTNNTDFPDGRDLVIDDLISVLGHREGSMVTADAIREIDPDTFPMSRHVQIKFEAR